MPMNREAHCFGLLTRTCFYLIILSLSLSSVSEAQDFERIRLADDGERNLEDPLIMNNDEKLSDEAALKRPERLTVIAPRFLRPNSDYHVLVNLAQSEVPATIDLQLTGARDSNREQTEAKSILANSGETQTIKFNIGDWPSAEYILSVTAQAVDRSWNFTQEKTLTYQAKAFSTFIQTDKAIYKPGQLVQFRIIALTKTLIPHQLKEEINVTVIDPRRNIVKQWNDLSNYRGLLSLDLKLSEDPMLGDWIIKVNSRQQEATKSFTVAEYILPTFDVLLQLPDYVTYNDSDIVATVKATYTYGKQVKGHVTLTVQPLVRFYSLDTNPLPQAQYRARLEGGSADINVDLVKDLKLRRDFFEREIEFFALVEEDLTGRKYNSTSTLKIHEKRIKIELLNDDRAFKPGLSMPLRLKVAYQNDKPVEDNGPSVELRYNAYGKTLESVKLEPIGGMIDHIFEAPKKVVQSSDDRTPRTPNYIQLEANYRGQLYHLPDLISRKSKSEQFIQISLPQLQSSASRRRSNKPGAAGKYNQPSANVNDDLKIRIRATEPMGQINCQGLAGGDIIWALSPNANNQSQYEFDIKIDQRMAPEMRVLCFYIRPENKEMIVDSIVVPVNGLMRNAVKITASRDEAKPGQEIEIGVQSKPNSLIGLLAIDQSVSLLKSGNDITQKDVLNEAKTYGGSSLSEPKFGGSVTTEDVFESSDVVIMTNNLVDKLPLIMPYLYSFNVDKKTYRQANALSRIVLDTDVLDREINAPEFHIVKDRSNEPPVIRSFFPETWIWENATTGPDGTFRIKRKAPDTITSWTLSAFSLNEASGFGLTNSPSSIKVFRPFFIKMNLPYSIIRGETVSIQAVIFNYSKRPTSAKVTLENRDGDFEFVEAANRIEDEEHSSDQSESKIVRIPAEDGASVSFLITPKKLGQIDIKVLAQGGFATDGVVRKLLVKPEGQTQHLNRAMLINLPGQNGEKSMIRNISLDVPGNAVPDSQKVFVSAVGDIMGPGLSNVDDLLRLPYGCGEQNMINLVPNIVILNYLQKTNRLKENQRTRAIRNIESGYQRQLNYKRNDGSFSAFGQSDTNGSVWLTAYVLKSLQQAKGFIGVDEQVIRRSANFIANLAKADGSIEEVGMLHEKSLQSGSIGSSSVYLTAYAMIALMQRPISPDPVALSPVALDEVLDKGLGYLENQLDRATAEEDPYDLAIIAYALTLANRKESMDRAYDKLWLKAQEDRDHIWWESRRGKNEIENNSEPRALSAGDGVGLERESELLNEPKKNPAQPPPLKPIQVNKKQSEQQFLPDSLSIEMTSMALLTAVRRGELERSFPIVSWLISKQNSNGGFASTQDTVLAIEALAAFAEAIARESESKSNGPSIDIELLYPRTNLRSDSIRRNNIDEILITKSNALVNQQIRMPDNITWVQLKATGSGLAVVQVSWQYNLMVSAEKPAFYLNPILDKTSNVNYLQLSVCTFYKAGDSSNMAVMEVELPSGYVADLEALPGLKRLKDVKRVDTSDGDTKVIIYLDKVTRDEICLTIPAHRTSKVSNNKPTPVSIYDYYDRKQMARIFYEPQAASSCDICDSDDCFAKCASKPKRSDKLVSLHEQRRSSNLSRDDRLANITSTTTSPSRNSSSSRSSNQQILPLAPVLMSLAAITRNLYHFNE